MTKADLITALQGKFHRVETPQEQQDYGNLKYYLVKVYDLINDGLRDMNIAFYVENEGEVNEAAYWSPNEPKPDPTSGFQQELAAYIEARITAGTIEAAYPEKIDPVNENAIFTVVMGDLTERRLFVDRDGNGDLRHRSMV